MHRTKALYTILFTIGLSAAAPAILAINGVLDPDLLLIVFAPSVIVGVASAWYARRPATPAKTWAFDSQRMP